jgi:hypothetical protein
VDGDLEQRLGTFRQVRDAIRETVLAYLQQIDNAPDKEISDDS